ncbi:serine/threonine-protein kinase [Pyxidicoccus trucidator]|uniref:serine/threonine-protein kinase n=1 Tax=Pyxidicoccus trucidator TaxID=2709662 RepID=UPI0013DD8640|nr:serine/threonine-protein kinase [Pyxidicoccus trucidator]
MSGPAADSGAYPWELLPGDQVNRWRIIERLGTGSYGVVYRVEGDVPGESYALKLALRPSDARAEREVALLARTDHPHVVRFHDWGSIRGVAGNHLYFVMDWVQGLPLHLWAEKTNPSLRELARVASTLALTLDWLHARGVHHRDLKPEHILIRASDTQPILIDFGVGRQEGASTLTSTVVPPGTVHLRSPEAVDFHRLYFREEGARYTFQPTDDLYALGVCLFRALAGHYPFPPDLPGDLLMLAILAHVPPPVTVINPRVPPAFSEVVARLLEKRPWARHGSGRELHHSLEAAQALGPAEAWEEHVFAWEEGPEPADPAERRTVRPVLPATPMTPVPELEAPPRRHSTGGRRAVGAVLLPPSVVADPAKHGLALIVVDRREPEPPRGWAAWATARQHAFRAGVALGVVVLLGLVAWVAAGRGAVSGPSSEEVGATFHSEPPLEDAPARIEAPSGGTLGPRDAVSPPLVENPPGADAAPMTQAKDTSDVKTSKPSSPPAKQRAKTPDAVRGALGAALTATCVGAACASPQQVEVPRLPAALQQARPPPEECPPDALEAMAQLQFDKVGESEPDGSLVPYEYEEGPAPAREGPAVFALDRQLGTLPRRGTTVSGRLFFAKGRVHGWFTEARTRDGQRFPVCMVLLDEDRRLGWAVEGPGDEPSTVLVHPIGKLMTVKRFK